MRLIFGALKLTMWLVALIAMVGCGGNSGQQPLPEPLGAASGMNTFILFYTDN